MGCGHYSLWGCGLFIDSYSPDCACLETCVTETLSSTPSCPSYSPSSPFSSFTLPLPLFFIFPLPLLLPLLLLPPPPSPLPLLLPLLLLLLLVLLPLLGVEVVPILELCGEQFFRKIKHSGHYKVVSCLGHTLEGFLLNLDTLHDHLTLAYPKMKPLSFR